MRFRKDKTSWHARGVIKRDEQHTKTPESEPKHRSKKDTKRWCKGVKGREHKLEWKLDRRHILDWYVYTCTICGKNLDYCWKTSFAWEKHKCKCGHHQKP